MPCIEPLKCRNPLRPLAAVGKTLYVWAPRRSPSQPYMTRTITTLGTGRMRTNEVWNDFPKDKNCSWTGVTTLIGEGIDGRKPYVAYSFAHSMEAAVTDIERLLAHVAALPAVESEIKQTVARLKVIAGAVDQLPGLDGGGFMKRADRAARLRRFLKTHGIDGLSVTTPQYAMATAVTIRLPSADNEERDLIDEAYKTLDVILKKIFPGNQNRPDPGSDYYGYLAWSIH